MAVHKVPQDVEADDKFLGPLSFRQFLFAGGVVFFGYLSFLTITSFFIVSPIFIIPTLGFAALAFPWSKEQPTELWLAARIRFALKPRKRIWDQTGVKQLVEITAPVRSAHIYTDGLSQNEVHNRLSALATMVDSRGWASKNSTYTTSQLPTIDNTQATDRLVAPINEAADETTSALKATEDVLDPTSGAVAKNFDQMIQKSEVERKEHNQEVIDNARKGEATKTTTQQQDFWFLNQSQQAAAVVTPGGAPQTQQQNAPAPRPKVQTNITKEQEEALLEKAHQRQELEEAQKHAHHERTITPAGLQPMSSPTTQQPQQPVQQTQPGPTKPAPQAVQQQPALQQPVQNQQNAPVNEQTNPDIMRLSNNDDLSIETISRQANKNDESDGEVVVPLR